MSNSLNQKGWPEVMSGEVLELFHKTVAGVYVALGQSIGMTLLPQPPAEMLQADRASKDKDRVHVLETAVVMWTGQIKSVLKTDPESVLTQKQASGEHPGPLEGLEFWASKAANLERIIQQLDSEKIRKVMKVLELTKSPYYTAFSALIKEVQIAHAEANDNVRFLAPLKRYFEQLHQNDDFMERSNRCRRRSARSRRRATNMRGLPRARRSASASVRRPLSSQGRPRDALFACTRSMDLDGLCACSGACNWMRRTHARAECLF